MWTFVASISENLKRISYDTLKSVCEEIANMEKNKGIDIRGCLTLSSITDKNSIPIIYEKYVVNDELLIPYYSPMNLLEICSALRNIGFAENRITQIAVYKVGWFKQ